MEVFEEQIQNDLSILHLLLNAMQAVADRRMETDILTIASPTRSLNLECWYRADHSTS
jgi:hypothetical protein